MNYLTYLRSVEGGSESMSESWPGVNMGHLIFVYLSGEEYRNGESYTADGAAFRFFFTLETGTEHGEYNRGAAFGRIPLGCCHGHVEIYGLAVPYSVIGRCPITDLQKQCRPVVAISSRIY